MSDISKLSDEELSRWIAEKLEPHTTLKPIGGDSDVKATGHNQWEMQLRFDLFDCVTDCWRPWARVRPHMCGGVLVGSNEWHYEPFDLKVRGAGRWIAKKLLIAKVPLRLKLKALLWWWHDLPRPAAEAFALTNGWEK